LIAELVYKKKGLDFENFDCCHKKKERRKSTFWSLAESKGKKIWSLGIYVAPFFFSGSIIVRLNFQFG
jgi:hypothetical protein